MPGNPVLLYAGIGATSIPIGLILFDGTRLATRGTFTRKPVTSGTAGDPLAHTGLTAWFSLPFAYDVRTVQYVVPDVDGNGFARSQRYRAVTVQRTHGTPRWDTCEAILADDPQVVPTGPDFSPLEFATG